VPPKPDGEDKIMGDYDKDQGGKPGQDDGGKPDYDKQQEQQEKPGQDKDQGDDEGGKPDQMK
jgi:hypothetical protein